MLKFLMNMQCKCLSMFRKCCLLQLEHKQNVKYCYFFRRRMLPQVKSSQVIASQISIAKIPKLRCPHSSNRFRLLLSFDSTMLPRSFSAFHLSFQAMVSQYVSQGSTDQAEPTILCALLSIGQSELKIGLQRWIE